MANTTKTVAATSAKVEAVKTDVKTAPAKTEDTAKKAPVAKKDDTVKKTAVTEDTAKKAATKKEDTAKKAPAKKTTAKKASEKAVKKNELYVQFSGFEFSYDELLEKVKADYIAQTGKKTITSTKLYVKPEDMKVYYVINEKFMGDVYLG